MPFRLPDYAGAFQRGREFSSQNTLADLNEQRVRAQMGAESQALERRAGVNQMLGQLPTVAPEGRGAYLAQLASRGQEGLSAAGDIQSMFSQMSEAERAEKLRRAQQISSSLAGVKDQSSYDVVRQEALRMNPQMADQLPAEYDPNIVSAYYNRFREIEDVLGAKGGSPIGKLDPGQYTPESLSRFQQTENYGDLETKSEPSVFSKVDPGQYTPASVAKFQESGNWADLIERDQGPKAAGPGQTQADKEFAKEYVKWGASGGFTDTTKQISQLRQAQEALQSGANLTGAVVGRTPDWFRAIFNPESLETRDAVEEVVQRNLRTVLGAQFTEKEGERLIRRAYNDNLGEPENAKRIGRLIRQIEEAAIQKADAMRYFQNNGTLSGWEGKLPTMSDFSSIDFDAPGDSGGTQDGWSIEEL